MLDLESLVQAAVTGIFTGSCTGFGAAIGIWLANRSLIKHLDKLGNGVKK
jgi:hypothetical protein